MADLPAGITYRQLDYWARVGLLRPENNARGSGRPRNWPETELAVAVIIGELRALGVELHVAARLARDLAESGSCSLSPKYTLIRHDDDWPRRDGHAKA